MVKHSGSTKSQDFANVSSPNPCTFSIHIQREEALPIYIYKKDLMAEKIAAVITC